MAEVAPARITLTETLLNLPSCRALTEIASSALKPVCHVRIVVSKAATMAGIVHPSVSVAYICTVEIISVDEVVVYKDIVTPPSSVPSPIVPASTPDCPNGKSGSPRHEAQTRRIIHRRIGVSRRPHTASGLYCGT